jgi:LysM repeat protein
MSYKKFLMVLAIGTLILSSCTMSYPGTNATPIPTNPFTKPMATDKMSEMRATATAMEMTAQAEDNGTTTLTPGSNVTPSLTPTPGAPGVGATATNTPQIGSVLPSNTPGMGGSGTGTTPTNTLVPVTGHPAQYTLQAGEFPYCIARRFNVNPDDLLSINGMSDGSLFMPGTTLKIPQTGSFPGTRALRPHPTTYTVTSSNETFYSIACLFGDVDPALIAQANGIALGTLLTAGKVLNIP